MDLKDINKRIVDRHDVFYWQAERKITEEEAGAIWKDRHSAIKNDELLKVVNSALKEDLCVSIDDVDPNKQESLGNVNSNRVGHLKSGKDVIIRCHPKGVENGYFFVESSVANLLRQHGLPSYYTYAIHECKSPTDCAFQVIEKLPGQAVQKFIESNPQDEDSIVFEIGKTMAKVHKIKVKGFGPFNNEKAKDGVLVGICPTLYDFVVAGLDFDLKTLVDYSIISKSQAIKFKELFSKDNPLLQCKQPILVHNDFADWNLLTDGKTISGIIDLDECVGGDPMLDLACWSTFFDSSRLDTFLKGYFSIAKKPTNFEKKFQLFRLRYSISKMTLRVRRYTYDKNEAFRQKTEIGKGHLKDSATYFGIGE